MLINSSRILSKTETNQICSKVKPKLNETVTFQYSFHKIIRSMSPQMPRQFRNEFRWEIKQTTENKKYIEMPSCKN